MSAYIRDKARFLSGLLPSSHPHRHRTLEIVFYCLIGVGLLLVLLLAAVIGVCVFHRIKHTTGSLYETLPDEQQSAPDAAGGAAT